MSDIRKTSCPACPRTDVSVNADGTLRKHAANSKRVSDSNPACEGSGNRADASPLPSPLPEESDSEFAGVLAEHAGAVGFICRVCKHPVMLTSNNRARSHLDPRTNPGSACDGGSDWPLAVDERGNRSDTRPDPALGALTGDEETAGRYIGLVPDTMVVAHTGTGPDGERFTHEGARSECAQAVCAPPARSDAATAGDGSWGDGDEGGCPCPDVTGGPVSPECVIHGEAVECECGQVWPGYEQMIKARHGDMVCHPDRPHRFEYGDDGMGHSGSFCSLCYANEEVATEPLPVQESSTADTFLAGGASPVVTGGAGTDSADGFLTGEVDEEDRTPPWFPARYDGSCDSCGADFAEGERIRADGSGGWEAEECCGGEEDGGVSSGSPTAVTAPERPRVTNATLPVKNGRYEGPDPETGKRTKWTRTTTFAETISDSIALDQWKGRMTILGLALRSDLVNKTRSIVQGQVPYEVAKSARQDLNAIVDQAKDAAGSKDRARKGTILHKHTEEIDSGRRRVEDVPEEFRPDVLAYLAGMEAAGFRLVPLLIERSVLSGELGVVGTFDRVMQCTKEIEQITPDGKKLVLHPGDWVIGDVKSGASLKFPWLEIEIQLAIYAHAVNENGIATPAPGENGGTTWRWAPLEEFGADKVREDVAVVMHIPYSEGRFNLHLADLTEGWRGAKLCKAVRELRKFTFPEPVMTVSGPEQTPVRTVSQRPENIPGPADSPSDGYPATHSGLPAQHSGRRWTQPAKEKPQPVTDNWSERFRAVRTREAAKALWLEARAAGVDGERLKILSAMVEIQNPQSPVSGAEEAPPAASPAPQPLASPAPVQEAPAPSWTERARSVKSKAEASQIFGELKAAVERNEIDKGLAGNLVRLMQKTLAA